MIELLIWRYGTWTVCSSHSAKAHRFASNEEQDVCEQIALRRLKTVQALVTFSSTRLLKGNISRVVISYFGRYC